MALSRKNIVSQSENVAHFTQIHFTHYHYHLPNTFYPYILHFTQILPKKQITMPSPSYSYGALGFCLPYQKN